MPGIETSSDIYQNRNQGLTTYRKNVQGPSLPDEMANRTEDRAKAAQVQARQEPATVAPKVRPAATAAPGSQAAGSVAATRPPAASGTATTATSATAGPGSANRAADADPVTPPKVVHELYEPTSRVKREHDDRHAMITGGTIDVRA